MGAPVTASATVPTVRPKEIEQFSGVSIAWAASYDVDTGNC